MKRIGFNPEDVFEEALDILLSEKAFPYYHRSVKNGEVDVLLHIDFVVILWNGLAIPFQIKGDPKKAQKYAKEHPFIKYVIVVNRKRPRFYAKKLWKIVKRLNLIQAPEW